MPTKPAPLLDRVREAIGIGTIEAGLAAITAARATTPAPTSPDPIAEAVEALLLHGAGPDSLANLGVLIRDREEQHATHVEFLNALDQVARRLHDTVRHQQVAGADDGLAVLRSELTRVLAAAQPVTAQLNGCTDPTAAIAAGVADTWQQAQTMACEMAEIRRVQAIVAEQALYPKDFTPQAGATFQPLREHTSKQTRELILTHGTVSDFRVRYPGGYVAPTPTPSGAHITVLAEDVKRPTALPWDTSSPPADLVWLVTNRDVIWLPSIQQLRDAETKARDTTDTADIADVLAAGVAAQHRIREDRR